MAKTPAKDETFRTGQSKTRARVRAKCKRNPEHKGARVYRTGDVRTDKETGEDYQRRWCVCDTCGETWHQDGPVATEGEE